jgi:hypothetical protein
VLFYIWSYRQLFVVGIALVVLELIWIEHRRAMESESDGGALSAGREVQLPSNFDTVECA